ncbi:MAG: SH3 domain-containing protein [Devosia sp.]
MKARTRKLVLNIATGVALAATAAVVFTPAMAQAAPAEATANVNVRSGPGTGFGVVGQLRAGQDVDVGECQSSFCYVQGANISGWVSASYLSYAGPSRPGPSRPEPSRPDVGFGVQIGPGGVSIGIGTPGFNPPRPDRPGRPGRPDREACFYEHADYAGRSFCMNAGDSINNLARFGNWNDRISSIDNDRLSVTVCEHADFRGSCRTYTTSTRSLGRLNDQISSIRVNR